jgi:hypothetical protein
MSLAQEPSAGCHRAFLGGIDFRSLLRSQFYALTDASGAQRHTAFHRAALGLVIADALGVAIYH